MHKVSKNFFPPQSNGNISLYKPQAMYRFSLLLFFIISSVSLITLWCLDTLDISRLITVKVLTTWDRNMPQTQHWLFNTFLTSWTSVKSHDAESQSFSDEMRTPIVYHLSLFSIALTMSSYVWATKLHLLLITYTIANHHLQQIASAFVILRLR